MDALKTQVGGEHYRSKAIQPIEYIQANNLDFCEGNVVKYITRWKDKDGLKDLEKARQYIDFLIEREKQREPVERRHTYDTATGHSPLAGKTWDECHAAIAQDPRIATEIERIHGDNWNV